MRHKQLTAYHVDIEYTDTDSGKRTNDGQVVYAKDAKQAEKSALRFYRKEEEAQATCVEVME